MNDMIYREIKTYVKQAHFIDNISAEDIAKRLQLSVKLVKKTIKDLEEENAGANEGSTESVAD